jgi:coenzyme F420-reducing hydrogenase beta subunit
LWGAGQGLLPTFFISVKLFSLFRLTEIKLQVGLSCMENTTENTKEAKIYQLVVELEDVRKNKKAQMRAYNEEIKRINDEIKELINED